MSVLVTKLSKFNANFTHLTKIFKLWLKDQFLVLDLYFDTKEKQILKAVFLNTLTLIDTKVS